MKIFIHFLKIRILNRIHFVLIATERLILNLKILTLVKVKKVNKCELLLRLTSLSGYIDRLKGGVGRLTLLQ